MVAYISMPTKEENKFAQAAFEYCSTESAVRNIRKQMNRCSEKEPASSDGVYPGNPPCDMDKEDDRLCEACLARRRMYPLKIQAMKDRGKAKQKLMRWFVRIAE